MGNKSTKRKKDKVAKDETDNTEGGDKDSTTKEEQLDMTKDVIFSENNKKVGIDDFELLMVIGKGSFGKVMQVRKKDTGEIYAMKVLRKEAIIERNQVTHTKAEKSILQKIRHPFIVALRFAFQSEDKLYMILDYVNGGELFFHLKREGRFSEDRVKLYVAEIVLSIHHLHNLDIVYRDLKPENILLDNDGHIRLTDFGLSKELKGPNQQGEKHSVTDDDGRTHTFCGTPEYLAPEILNGHGHGKPVDWWSLGTLMFEMLTSLPPFYSQNINVMYHKILNGELRIPPYVSADAKGLLIGLLERNPDERFDGEKIKGHPFFASLSWEDVLNKKVEPLFKPKVKHEHDGSQIDAVFTAEKPCDSVVDRKLTDAMKQENDFQGFTYVSDNELTK